MTAIARFVRLNDMEEVQKTYGYSWFAIDEVRRLADQGLICNASVTFELGSEFYYYKKYGRWLEGKRALNAMLKEENRFFW